MAIYYVWSGATGSGNGSSWANAFTTLTLAFVTEVAGDTLFVAHDHAESTASAVTLTSSGTIANPTKIVCVNRAGSVPPVSADRRTTATVTASANNNLTITGFAHYDGIIFNAGTGASSSANLLLGTAHWHWLRFDNCSLRLGITAGTSKIFVAGTVGNFGGTYVELNNTTLSFGAATHSVQIVNALRWKNTPSALLGTVPGLLLAPLSATGGSVECIGVDLSAAGSGKTLAGAAGSSSQAFTFRFIDCKLDAAVTKSGVQSGHGTCDVDFIRSGASGVNYTVHSQRISGLLTEETTIVRTGGASDGLTPISWKIVTTANCIYSMPFECPPIAIWNDATGSAVTATVEGVWGGGAVPLDDEVWLDVEYLGDALSPQGSFVNDGKANLLAAAANQASSSEAWGGSTTQFKLACAFTPQQRGWVYARVKCAKPSSTFYIDPMTILS